jgi:hypothetical protein
MADSAVAMRPALVRKQKVDDEPSGKRSRGREKIDDETLASRRSRETQSSRRSSSVPRSTSGKKSSSRRREDDTSSTNRMALTAGHLSTADGETDRDARSTSLERHESSSRRPVESPRKITEKLTDSSRLTGENPLESPSNKTESSKRLSLDSSRKTQSSPRKKIVESPPSTESPSKRTENPTDSPRLRNERPPESQRKSIESSKRLSLDSPKKTPSTPKKKIVETSRKTTESPRKTIPSSPRKSPDSQRNRVSDSLKKSASDSIRKTSSVSLLTGKENPTKSSPLGEKSVSPRKVSSSPSKSMSQLIPPDQSPLLEDLTRKLIIDSMDAMRGPETFKAAKTNDVIKKHFQDVAVTGAKQKESTGFTSRASPGGSSLPKELNRRKEESKSSVEGQSDGQSLADRIVRQIVLEHCDGQKSVTRTEIARSEAQDHRLQTRPSGRAERITI